MTLNDFDLEDARLEAAAERHAKRKATCCQCGFEFGVCPGPANCPCVANDDEDDK